MIAEDSKRRAEHVGIILAQRVHAEGATTCVPVDRGAGVVSHPADFASLVAHRIALVAGKDFGVGSTVVINLNLTDSCLPDRSRRLHRLSRAGLLVVDALRRLEAFSGFIYGYSFESFEGLNESPFFCLLFQEFGDCHRYLRLPSFPMTPHPGAPEKGRLDELGSILKAMMEQRTKGETRATLQRLLMCFAHDHDSDLSACLGPLKATLRVGYYDLASRSEGIEALVHSLGQLKREANSLDLESPVKRIVLLEIDRLESLWEEAAEAIGRIGSLSGSPERESSFRSAEALEKITAFEKRIAELQRG